MRWMVVEVFDGHIVKADGVTPWADRRVLVYEVAPGQWFETLTTLTWPG